MCQGRFLSLRKSTVDKIDGFHSAVTLLSGSPSGARSSLPSPVRLQVVVRCRPLNSKEVEDGRQRIVDMDVRQGQVVVRCRVLACPSPDRMFGGPTPRSLALQVKNPKAEQGQPPMMFTFDQARLSCTPSCRPPALTRPAPQVYDMTTKQRDLYDITARPIVDAALDGYNGTIFAYGQVRSLGPTARPVLRWGCSA